MDYGISLDSDGHLQVDSDKFNEAMEENPDGLILSSSVTTAWSHRWTALWKATWIPSTGIIAMREDNIEDQQGKIQDESDQLTQTYNHQLVTATLEEYTNTLIETYIHESEYGCVYVSTWFSKE